MVEIAIITPLKRLENIPIIFSNIRKNIRSGITVHWFTIFDQSEEKTFEFWKIRLEYLGKEDSSFIIHPILSSVDKAIAGHAHRNIALEEIKKCFGENSDIWIYNCDDDNLIHEDFFNYLIDRDKRLAGYTGLLVSQIMKDGRLRLEAHSERVIVCHVDTAQLVFKLKYLKDLKYIENDYCADGHFIHAFYEQNDQNVYIEKTPLCYYNFLQKVN